MTKIGKFILFDIAEFSGWLSHFTNSRTIKLVQNHHTWMPDYSSFNGNNHFQLLQSMEDFHVRERGFAEIAQNLTSFPDGKVALCRSLDKIPAGIKGANAYGICLENLGNFDKGKNVMTEEQKNTIVKLNAILCRKFDLFPSIETIVYHHWYDLDSGKRTDGLGNTKTCPGTNFFGGNTVHDCLNNFIPLVKNVTPGLGGPDAGGILDNGIQHGVVDTPLLNVRADGSVTAAILKVLNGGTPVSIYEEKNGWYRIDGSGKQWVKEDYVKLV